MKKILKNLIILFLIIIMVFILTACQMTNQEQNNILNEKIINEIEYLDSKIIGMMNSMNNISYQNYKVSTEEIELDKASGKSGEQSSNSQEQGQKDKGEQGETQGESKETQTINKSEMSYSSILNAPNQPINWDIIKSDIEVLHSTWNTVIIDLKSKSKDENLINDFSNSLDSITISIKNENKLESLTRIS